MTTPPDPHGPPAYGPPPYGPPAYGPPPYGPPASGPPQWGPPVGWAPPLPPPPTRGRNALIVAGCLLGVLVLVAGGFALFGPGSSGASSASSVATPAGSATGDQGGSVTVDVQVGGCIHLGGTVDDATAEPEPCGSEAANYQVIGTAPTEEGCAADVDAAYYETDAFGTGRSGALCLDVDWEEGDCFRLPTGDDGDPARIRCASATGGHDVQVGRTLEGTTDDSACAEGGAVYDTRDFVVCLDTPKSS